MILFASISNNYLRQCDLEEKSVKRRNSKWS